MNMGIQRKRIDKKVKKWKTQDIEWMDRGATICSVVPILEKWYNVHKFTCLQGWICVLYWMCEAHDIMNCADAQAGHQFSSKIGDI